MYLICVYVNVYIHTWNIGGFVSILISPHKEMLKPMLLRSYLFACFVLDFFSVHLQSHTSLPPW